MSGFGVLLLRELRRRLPIHLACLGSGIFVLAFPWIPGVSTSNPDMLRGVGAVSVAVLWTLLLALLEGFHFLASDLKEGRLAFDFRLPVAGSTIWAARLAAVLLTLAAAVGLSLAPPALANADVVGGFTGLQQLVFGYSGLEVPHPLLFAKSVVLVLLLIANGKALAFASRSARVGIDLSVLGALGFAAGFSITALWRYGASARAGFALELFLAAGAISLLVASWFQLTRGRTETDRAHAAFTPALAAIGVGAILILGGSTLWFLSPGPGDLERGSARATTLTSETVWMNGRTTAPRNIDFAFLLEPSTGRYARLGLATLGQYASAAHGSADGSTVAWMEFERRGDEIWRQRLLFRTRPFFAGHATESPISWPMSYLTDWALSPDGSRVASYGTRSRGGQEHLVIEDLRTGSTLESLAIPPCINSQRSLQFLSQTRVLVACGCTHLGDDTPSDHTLDVDLTSKSWSYLQEYSACGVPKDRRMPSQPGRFFEPPRAGPGDPPRLAGRIVGQNAQPIELEYPTDFPDGRTPNSARFLADGRLATTWLIGRDTVVVLFDRSGDIERAFELSVYGAEILAELDDRGLVLFSAITNRPPGTFKESSLIRLDPQSGETLEVARDVQPTRPDSAVIPTTLFREKGGRTLWLDLKSGKLSPLLHGS